jgi:predicted nucleic acid-binding protein
VALYLLDADAVIDYLNQIPASKEIIDSIVARGDAIGTCEVVLAEVYAGLRPEDEASQADFLESLLFLSGNVDVAILAGRWRYRSARQGRPLTTNDVLIAATAHEHRATVVTANVGDYPMPEVSVLPLPR